MKQDRILSLLGLTTKAGAVVSGEFSTEKAIKEGNAKVVIVAQDASDNKNVDTILFITGQRWT